MTRLHAVAAAFLTLATVACGPMEAADEPALLGAPGTVARSASGAAAGLQLSTTAPVAGSTLLVTVGAPGAARVYLGFPKAVFAGPAWVAIPGGASSVTVTLHVSPYLTSPALATISARTQSPDPATFFSQAVTAVPAAALPPVRAQVASAVLTPATVVTGGAAALDVTLTAPAPAGGAAVQVAITNDFFGLDADVAPVLLVPAGATQASATIRAHLSSAVASSVTESVIANLFGGTFQGGPLVVTAR